MTIPAALAPEALYQPCPLEDLTFESTAELSDGRGPFGQARAIEALRFGLEIKQPGHNLFVMGPPGSGRRSFVADVLAHVAQSEPAVADWCYVNDFDNPEKPRALRLPAGAGRRLAADVTQFIDDVQAAVSAAFSSEKYRAQRQAIEHEFQEQQSEAFERVQAAARERGIRIMQTPGGMVFAPIVDGEVLGPEEFEKLPAERQREIQQAVEAVGKLLQESMKDVPDRLRASRE
ncbi:MAG: ATP-dependent protease, partial [Gammaproteobacteria bacterium]